MASKEIGHVVKSKHLLDQTAITSATMTTGALDTLGAESASIVLDVSVWAGAGSTWTPKLQESDAAGSGFTDCLQTNVDWFIDGTIVTTLLDANGPVVQDAASDQCTIMVNYVGGQKRYIKMVVTLAGSPTTMVMAAIGLTSHLREVGPKAYTNWPTYGNS